MTNDAGPRTVWFHREFERLTGGHVKHAHYFGHVGRMPGFERRLTFTETPEDAARDRERERRRLWPASPGELADRWQPAGRDVLFLAGTDWRYLAKRGLEALANPRLNLIQGVRHAHAGTELHGYLANRAVRVCVSAEVAEAIEATGRVNGPVFTIPNGTDCAPVEAQEACAEAVDARPEPITIVGYKRVELAAALSRQLHAEGVRHRLLDGFLDRDAFLELLRRTRVAVCLPLDEEGFYLPALEAMAAGCTVVTLDCIGNRGFCRHEDNCLVAGADVAALAEASRIAVQLPAAEASRLHRNAADTVRAHSLDKERERFHWILREIDRLWSGASVSAPSGAVGGNYRPTVDFMIVGTQKGGTTALSRFLARHPRIGMASEEGHLFDSPGYSAAWTPRQIDERYRRRFDPGAGGADGGGSVLGESTPIYMYLDEVPAQLARYNPDLKVVVALRDPVERAVSHYDMERGRGKETLPLWLALLAEPWRIGKCREPQAPESAVRRHSYRSRGLYSRQLRNLYRVFPRERVLVIRSEDLLDRHDAVLDGVFAFLGVSMGVSVPREVVFKGERDARKHRLARFLLRVSFLLESARLRLMLARPEVRRARKLEHQ